MTPITIQLAGRLNVAAMTPTDDLTRCSTRYCLHNLGRDYLVFQPEDKSEFTVNLADAPGTFSAEWINVSTGEIVPSQPVERGTLKKFVSPFAGPAALYLKRQ